MSKDYYAVLGVKKTADPKEIKAAYRRLARKYHPDVNKNDKSAEQKFKDVSEAYDTLSDPEKRKLYDQFGAGYEQVQTGGGNFGDFAGGGISMEDIFGSFFSGGGQRVRGGTRIHFDEYSGATGMPQDVEKTIEIPLDEVDAGTRRTLTYQTMDAQRMREGIASVPTTKKVEIDIPAGTPDGGKIKVRGKGTVGLGGKAGDLYVTVQWKGTGDFRAVGDQVEVELTVPFQTAILGGEVKVPTLRGTRLTMSIPPGTQGGQLMRLAKQGMRRLDGSRSDLLARVKIGIPKQLSEEQRRLIEQFSQLESK